MRNSFPVALAAVVVSCFAGVANANVVPTPPTADEISSTSDLTVNAPSTQVSFGNNSEWAEFVFTVSANQERYLSIVVKETTRYFRYESFISPSTFERPPGLGASTPFSLALCRMVSGHSL